MDIAEIGYRADTADLKGAKRDLDALVPATRRAETEAKAFTRAINYANGASAKFMRSLEMMAFKLGTGIGGELKRAAIGFGALFGVGGFLIKITQTAGALDAVSKAARATGSSVESMQALSIAGDLAGVSVDTVASATRRMNRVLGDAIAKGKGTEGVFQRLGISAKELAALPIDQRFATVADQMQKLGFSTSDATAALALLGDRGGSLIGLLGEGGAQIRAAAGDVDRFHLAITDLQGANIEEMNDNFSRLGYSIQGAFNQFIATIAPAMSAIFIGMANGIAAIVENMGNLGTILQIVGPALLVAFGPVILGAVWALTVAIGTGLVGAITTLTTAIAANPLGAIAVGITLAISAIWTFRDAIQQAFGVDVGAIVKSAANFIIQVLLTAFEQIKLVWNTFPNVIGAAVIGATNAVIAGVNLMIGAAIAGVNTVIDAVRNIPGVDQIIQRIDPGTGQIPSVGDPYSAKIAAEWDNYRKITADIAHTDYVGQIAASMVKTSEATTAASTAVTGLGSTLDDVSAGGGSLDKAKQGLSQVDQMADKVRETMGALADEISGGVSDAFKSFFKDIWHGKSAVEALKNSLGGLADKLFDMVLNNVASGLFGGLFGAGSIAGGAAIPTGGFIPGLTGPMLMANGGILNGPTMLAGGAAIGGEAGPEGVLPLKRGSNGQLGVINHANDNPGVVFIQPIINNNASDQVQASAGMSDDGQLVVTIDRMTARNIADTSSQTNKAIQRSFGTKNTTVKR